MSEERTVYVTSLHDKVDKLLLEEIFTQVGPVNSVNLRDNNDLKYAFVEFIDEESVLFACKTLDGLRLHNRAIRVKPRNNTEQARKWQEQQRYKTQNFRYDDYDHRDSYHNNADCYSDYRPNPRYQEYETPPGHIPARHSRGDGSTNGRAMHLYKPYARDLIDDSWRKDSRRSNSNNTRGFDLYRESDSGLARQHYQDQRSGRKVFHNNHTDGGGRRH